MSRPAATPTAPRAEIITLVSDRILRAREDGRKIGYDAGFAAGESVGRLARSDRGDRMLGLGVLIGSGIGTVFTLLVLGFLR